MDWANNLPTQWEESRKCVRGDAKDRFGHLDTPLPVIIHTVILLNQEIIKQFTKYVKFKVDNVVAEPEYFIIFTVGSSIFHLAFDTRLSSTTSLTES